MLSAGIVYRRGMVLGRITANNKMALSALASTDGSQVPYGICIQLALILGTGQTVASIHDPLRFAGIYLKPVVPA